MLLVWGFQFRFHNNRLLALYLVCILAGNNKGSRPYFPPKGCITYAFVAAFLDLIFL